jgi:RecA/RadA recombinase
MTVVRKSKKKEAEVSELVPPAPAKRNERLIAFEKAAKLFEDFKPASQVLTKVRAVPTRFVSFDKGSRVKGLPLQRVIIVTGESAEGKTIYQLGIEDSFIEKCHFVFHVDAEMTTSTTWCTKLMGEHAKSPGYYGLRPSSYENASDRVRAFMNQVGELRAKGKVPEDTAGFVGVDSINRLMPTRLLEKLLKDGSEEAGLDGMSGAAGRYKAALNNQWIAELIPLSHDTNCTVMIIVREYENQNASTWDRQHQTRNTKTLSGGYSIKYDSSMTLIVSRDSYIYNGSGDKKETIGERHKVQIKKSKVGGLDDKVTETYFHTSNGKFTPEGFDRARDVLELAREMKIVTGDGVLSFNGERLGNGENQSVRAIYDKPGVLEEMEARVRAGIVGEDDEATQ